MSELNSDRFNDPNANEYFDNLRRERKVKYLSLIPEFEQLALYADKLSFWVKHKELLETIHVLSKPGIYVDDEGNEIFSLKPKDTEELVAFNEWAIKLIISHAESDTFYRPAHYVKVPYKSYSALLEEFNHKRERVDFIFTKEFIENEIERIENAFPVFHEYERYSNKINAHLEIHSKNFRKRYKEVLSGNPYNLARRIEFKELESFVYIEPYVQYLIFLRKFKENPEKESKLLDQADELLQNAITKPGLETLFIDNYPEELMSFLTKEYTDSKPKPITIMLYALHSLGLIEHPAKHSITELHKLLVNTFGDVGTREAHRVQIRNLESAPSYDEKKIKKVCSRIQSACKKPANF